jgi:hypothetical protein
MSFLRFQYLFLFGTFVTITSCRGVSISLWKVFLYTGTRNVAFHLKLLGINVIAFWNVTKCFVDTYQFFFKTVEWIHQLHYHENFKAHILIISSIKFSIDMTQQLCSSSDTSD